MLTTLRWYVALGLIGCCLFGGISEWAGNRHMTRLDTVTSWITLACLPALLVGGLVILVGSIGLG